MLTTTLDGLWALQVLSGIECLAPELGLRPHLPSIETKQSALAHPVAWDLLDAGVIDFAGEVDIAVREWLTVLSRRDVALLLHRGGPRVLLARFAHWWVTIERSGDLVRLRGVSTATDEPSAAAVICDQIDELCGRRPPAEMRPVSFNADEMLTAVRDAESLRKFLQNNRIDHEQTRLLTLASDAERSDQTSVVAIQSGVGGTPRRSHIGAGAVTVIDTPDGRLLAEHVNRDGTAWMVVGPGTSDALTAAVQTLMRRLPAQQNWYSHRKAV